MRTSALIVRFCFGALFVYQAGAVLLIKRSAAANPVTDAAELVSHAAKAVTDAAKANAALLIKSSTSNNPVEDAADAVEDAVDDVEDELKDMQKGEDNQPLMDPIEQMRAEMCANRDDLAHHEQCSEWLVKKCSKESSGHGHCDHFKKEIVEECKKGTEQACKYAKDMGIDVSKPEEAAVAAPAPAAVPAVAAPAPAAAKNKPEEEKEKKEKVANRKGFENKDASQPLHSQGYSEHSSKMVKHSDGDSMTGDWGKEWPQQKGTEQQSMKSICREHPKNAWCQRNGFGL